MVQRKIVILMEMVKKNDSYMRENDLQQNPITYPTTPVMKLGYDCDMVGWHGLEIVKVYPSISTALT